MKRRIMFLESRYDSYYGAQKSMMTLIRSLDKTFFDFKIVTTGIGKFIRGVKKDSDYKVDVIKIGKKANTFGGKILEYSTFEKILVAIQILIYNIKILNYLIKNKIDIIYVNDIRALLYTIIASKLLKKKIVWYIRGEVPNNKLTDIGLKYSDFIITIANGVLKNIPEEKIKKINYKITNIYTGFDFSEFKILDKKLAKKKLSISENKFVIGYLGSINDRKGIDILIDAYLDLLKKHDNIELVIAGDVSHGYEEYWNKLKLKIKEEGGKFTYIPYCQNVSLVYSALDVFVLPSRSEGLPRVVIEAMAHNLVVICTNVGGASEIIEHKINGLLIKKDSVHDLYNAIDFLITKPKERKKISNNTVTIKNKFDLIVFQKEINQLFKNI